MFRSNSKDRLQRADETVFSTDYTQFLFIKYRQEVNIKENEQPRKILKKQQKDTVSKKVLQQRRM